MKRFWDKVQKTPYCWNWTGCKRDGYGLFRERHGRSMHNAHRYSWELKHGQVPHGLLVLHRCDNRACVRPSHLWIGDIQANMDDRNRKGRQARGERAGRATITLAQALAVRALKPPKRTPWGYLRNVSASLEIDKQTISDVWRGKTWSHL